MSLSRASFAVGLLAVSFSAPALAAGRPTEWSLPSGLTILHQPDPRFPVVRVLVTVGAGTADTARGQRPLAHLAEHVAFRAPLAGGAAYQTLRAAGCDINGFTALDTTTFQAACPTDAAPLAVAFAATLATHGFGVNEADVQAEARIVLAETTERLDAGRQTADQFVAGLFTEDHPYNLAERVPDDLLALTSTDVRRFIDTHYVPSKVVIAVQGDMDAPTLAGSLARVAADGFAHPRQRHGDIADWPAGAIQIQWLSPTPATWFRDPDDATRPLDPAPRPGPVTPPTPAAPKPDTTLRTTRHSGTWPQVRVAWYLPPARHANWFHLGVAETYADDTLRAVFRTKGVIGGGCASILGIQGSALTCTFSLEEEDLQEALGRRIAHAFERAPDYTTEKRQRDINNSDARGWQGIVDRDLIGLDDIAALSTYRLATGRFDVESGRDAALGGGGGYRAWEELRATWLKPEAAVVTYLSPEPRASIAATSDAMGGGVPGQLVHWPAPALGPAGADQAVEEVLSNGLRTVLIQVPAAEAAAWRLSVPSLPGLEHLEPVIDAALKTPNRFEGNRIYYDWHTRVEDGGTVHLVNQRGLWEPRPLVRALWATVEARRIGDLAAAFRRYVKQYVYAGRSPYTWRWRAWRRATRENPERDGIPEVDEVIRTRGAVEAYLAARYQPERATLFLVGRQPPEAKAQLADELDDWRASEPAPLELPVARRRAPTPEIVLLDDNSRGRTVSVTWACPIGSGEPLDPFTVELVAQLASNRLYDVVRASNGLTYTPSAYTDVRWGRVDLVLEAPTELGQESRVLEALRTVARDLANGASAPMLSAARRQVLSGELHAGSSLFGLASYVSRGVLQTGTLSALHAHRAALATRDSAAMDALFRPCAAVGAALLVGPVDELQRNLTGESLPVRVFDWRAEQLALVKRWAPSTYAREEAWLARAQGSP